MQPTIIADIRAEALDMPLTEPFAIATGTQQVAHNVLIRLVLGDGTEGLGEAAPFPAVSGETQQSTLEALVQTRALLLGRDARSWRKIGQLLAEVLPDQPAARCGIEMALLDALLRRQDMPLWSFFGGSSTALETDMTITAGDAQHTARAARAIADRGIETIKVKVGALSPEEDVQRLATIHQALPQARLLADANGGYTAAQALAFLQAVASAQIPLLLLEQPLPREDWAGQVEVARRSPIPICADESVRSAADVLHIVRTGAAHVINIKLMKCGLDEALSMWSIARAAGLQLMIGGMVESILAMTFSAHFAAGLGGFSYVDLDTPMFIAAHPFKGGFRQQGARLSLDHIEAGHGVELREK